MIRFGFGSLLGFTLISCGYYYRPEAGSEIGVLPDDAAAESQKFRTFAQAAIDWHYAAHPVDATFDGIHDYDGRLGRYTREAMEGRALAIERQLARLGGLNRATLDAESYYDLLVLEGHLRAALHEITDVRSWERNPNFYRGIISGGLYSLAALAFDTPERRMALAAERLADVPAVLAAARENLAQPPRIYTEMAIDEFNGAHSFLKNGLAQAFAGVKDETIRARFLETRAPALLALEQFVDWLRKDLLPKSTGDFAIGPDAYRKKLLYEEGVATPLDTLLQQGYQHLRSTQEAMKKIAGDRPLRQLLRETGKEHPSAERLLVETREMLDELKRWASGLVDVPADADCRVQETPEFRRSMSFASMETPGPFEKVARDAYYSITLPDPRWDTERAEQHLAFFNRFNLRLISVHEAFPGHYTQFLAVQKCPSTVRKVFGCASFAEGWAHYCEQLYVEDKPDAVPALRLQQLSLALLRICRYIMGLEMHTKGTTYAQAVEFFVNEGYLERVQAEREARRGTADPTYLVYTLGKLEILKLRDEYRARTGASLKDFHDALLRTGYPPLPIARKILFGER